MKSTAKSSSRVEPAVPGFVTSIEGVQEGFLALVCSPAGVVKHRFLARVDWREVGAVAVAYARALDFVRPYEPSCSACGEAFSDREAAYCRCGACRGGVA